ncbi:MAG: tRNA (adenosine(37)-N6)-threonylcarbamoyltransferase complex dimerization subunit type 1 TsaB, partial [Chloroflexi bacterium]|nr:tRNA (adenosine(37)-N6)-threonylcarbamoyltransferase complex dimerization subunit type 1 TsaB [Chloroflexota bacterium]
MILALDTATRAISLALAAEHTVLAEATWLTRNNHTVELAPAVERMLAEAGLATRDLTAV